MEKTPKAKSRILSCKPSNSNKFTEKVCQRSPIRTSENTLTSTPIQQSKRHLPDDSPVYMLSTQESNEDVDVIWDYYSPQAEHPRRFVRKQKRVLLPQSPKVPLKKHPSNNQIQSMDVIKEELQALRNKMFSNTNDNCLEFESDIDFDLNRESENLNDMNRSEEMLFQDDSLEEQLLLCSQEVEKKILYKDEPENQNQCEVKRYKDSFVKNFAFREVPLKCNKNLENLINGENCNNNISSSSKNTWNIYENKFSSNTHISEREKINTLQSKLEEKNLRCGDKNVADDSFDQVLAAFNDEDLEVLTQAEGSHQKFDNRTNSKNNSSCPESDLVAKYLGHNQYIQDQPNSSANKDQMDESNSKIKYTMDLIERKRLEALAKLEAKKKQNINPTPLSKSSSVSDCETSPIKCSPEEIEQKRLQALAKLEAKKKQDIIERNRQEALKRLEMNKKKRAEEIKTTLPRRTDYSS